MTNDLAQRITDCLNNGGLFNLELTDHIALRDLLIECRAALAAQLGAEGEPLTDSFVQTVPDKCDRIVWRNSYYHLPFSAAPTEAAQPGAVPSIAEIRGAVARGWCSPENERKEMDSDLALAIADEVSKLLEAALSDAPQAEGWVMVPVEPNYEMQNACLALVDLTQGDPDDSRYEDGRKTTDSIYRAMIAARPSAPTAVEPTAEQSSVVEPDERAEFEAWYGQNFPEHSHPEVFSRNTAGNGEYWFSHVQSMRDAYEAGRASKGTPL